MVNSSGGFFKQDGASCHDYYSFGVDILAPADGTVVEAVDGLRDNKPRELNNFNYIGNYLMIKHRDTLYSVLGHLKQGSILPKVDDMIK